MICHILGNLRVVAECCQRLAELACFGGHGMLAARLLGASSALREAVGSGYLPAERAEYPRGAAAARRAVGEDMYEVAWQEGHAAPWEGVLATALDTLLRGRPASSTPTSSTRLNQAHGTSVSA